MISKYDLSTRNSHNKQIFRLVTDGHIYTLNRDMKRLEQKEDEEDSDHFTPHVGDAYRIKEHAEGRQSKVLANIDDIPAVIRNVPKPEDPKVKQVLTLIHKEDNLTDSLYEFVGAGYSPGVNFESGRITALKLELNKVFCTIQSQQ